MEHKNIRAIVVKEAKFKEKDKIYTLITDCMGKISVSARGISSVTSKLAGGIGQTCVSEIDIKDGVNGVYILTGAKKVLSFDKLTADLEGLSYANHILSLASDLFLPEEPFPALFKLVANTLFLISEKKKDYELLKSIFEFRALGISGYALELSGCGYCGKNEVTHLDVNEGVALCLSCGKEHKAKPVSAHIVMALMHIMYCDDKNIFSFKLGDALIKEMGKISDDYVKSCMEKEYPSLAYLRKIQQS